MPVAVIVRLEKIDIEHDERQGSRFARRPPPFLIKKIVELPPIGDAGQAVKARQTQQHLIGFLQLAHDFQQFLLAGAWILTASTSTFPS